MSYNQIIVKVHIFVYDTKGDEVVKKKDLEKYAQDMGWWPDGGTKHDKWTNGTEKTIIPRAKEIKKGTAKSIIEIIESFPGKNKKDKVKKPGN